MEKDSLIKDGNFIVLQDWMVKKLKLTGNELIVYAIIHGFSQAENQSYTGSLQYLAEWTNISKPGVLKCLNKLIDKNLIIKCSFTKNGVNYNIYNVNRDMLTQVNSVNSSKHPLTLVNTHSLELTNNIDINNKEKNIDKRKYIKEKSDYWTKIYKDRNFCNPFENEDMGLNEDLIF